MIARWCERIDSFVRRATYSPGGTPGDSMAPPRTSARMLGGDAEVVSHSYYLSQKGGGYGGNTAGAVERVFTQFNGLREKPSALVTAPFVGAGPPAASSTNHRAQPNRPSPHGQNVKSPVGRATSAASTVRQPPSSSNGVGGGGGDRSDVRRALSEGWRLGKSGRRPDRYVP